MVVAAAADDDEEDEDDEFGRLILFTFGLYFSRNYPIGLIKEG